MSESTLFIQRWSRALKKWVYDFSFPGDCQASAENELKYLQQRHPGRWRLVRRSRSSKPQGQAVRLKELKEQAK